MSVVQLLVRLPTLVLLYVCLCGREGGELRAVNVGKKDVGTVGKKQDTWDVLPVSLAAQCHHSKRDIRLICMHVCVLCGEHQAGVPLCWPACTARRRCR